MRKEYQYLAFLYAFLVILKIILSVFVTSPSIFGDEYIYTKLATNFLHNGEFMYHGETLSKYPFLYSLFLSPATIFANMEVVFFLMKVINAFLSSLVVFPLYFIAREFLSSKKSLFIAVLIGLFSSFFNISNYVLSENLFYPLFLFTIYFLYLAFSREDLKYFYISGVFLGLCFLTRILGISLVPVAFLVFLRYRKNIHYIFVHYFVAFLVVLPLLFGRVLRFGFSPSGLLGGGYKGVGYVATSFSVTKGLIALLNWFVIYSGYIFLAVGILLGVYYLLGIYVKEKKFAILYTVVGASLFTSLLVAANQANVFHYVIYSTPFEGLLNERVIGRYVDPIVGLVFLLGFIVYERFQFSVQKERFALFFTGLVLFVSLQLFVSPLVPMNNQALSFFGLIFIGLEKVLYGQYFLGTSFHWLPILLMEAGVFFLLFFLYKFREHKRFFYLILVVFVLITTLLSFGVTVWQSSEWSSNDQVTLGKWFNEYDHGKSLVFFEENGCDIGDFVNSFNDRFCIRRGSLLSFWISNDILIGEYNGQDVDYVFSQRDLSLDLLRMEGNFRIYSVGKFNNKGELA
jgi:hypothetical protein